VLVDRSPFLLHRGTRGRARPAAGPRCSARWAGTAATRATVRRDFTAAEPGRQIHASTTPSILKSQLSSTSAPRTTRASVPCW